jgi:hypothetical protein
MGSEVSCSLGRGESSRGRAGAGLAVRRSCPAHATVRRWCSQKFVASSVPSRLTDAISSSSAAPILLSSSLVHAVIGAPPSVLRFLCRAGASELDHDLDRLPLVHRPVTLRHLVEAHDPVEDSTRLDPAFEDIWQKLLDVRAYRGGSAAHGDVVVEPRQRCRNRLVLGNTNAADSATRTGDAAVG